LFDAIIKWTEAEHSRNINSAVIKAQRLVHPGIQMPSLCQIYLKNKYLFKYYMGSRLPVFFLGRVYLANVGPCKWCPNHRSRNSARSMRSIWNIRIKTFLLALLPIWGRGIQVTITVGTKTLQGRRFALLFSEACCPRASHSFFG
jgi:hypothetical protein